MGSLGEDVDVSNITYRNIYTVQSNQMVKLRVHPQESLQLLTRYVSDST